MSGTRKHHGHTDTAQNQAALGGALAEDFAALPPGIPAAIVFDSSADPVASTSSIETGENGQSFTTGPTSSILGDLEFSLASTSPGTGTITVSVWSDNPLTGPDTELGVIGTIDDSLLSSTGSLVTFIPTNSPTLTADTRYWIDLNSTGTGDSWDYTASLSGSEVATEFVVVDGSFSTDAVGAAWVAQITTEATCYAAGTRILTDRGEIPVEALRPGDRAMALRRGQFAEIRWIGMRDVDLRAHPSPGKINPIRITAGAFAPGVPHRDLLVSPDHAIFAGESLVTARYLVNGATIFQESPPRITYYHVELDCHDVLLAEGLPAESYLDVGNRTAFRNGGGPIMAHPDFARRNWDAKACAPSLHVPEQRAPLRARLLARALALGHSLTTDPNLHLRAGAATVAPSVAGNEYRFELPRDTRRVCLESRSTIPTHTRTEQADGRRLGVGIAHLALDGIAVALHDPRLTTGWHAPEPALRWTNGNAWLETEGARTLTLRLHHGGLGYWLEPEQPAAALRRA